jgi:hypothetical protein
MKIIFMLILTYYTLCGYSASRSLYLKKYANEKKTALVIGNSNYSGQLSKLQNPVNDATDVKDALEKANFEVLFLLNANQQQIDEKLREFSDKLKSSAIGLFYFAGHGIEIDKQNYLVPVDADIRDRYKVKYKTIAVAEIVNRMKNSGTRLNMLVLDACRNDPFSRGGGGLAPISTARGVFIAYATAPGSVAADNANEKNGLYTKYFLKTLKQKNLNQRDFFYIIKKGVYNESGGLQTPYISDGTIGDFYFYIDKDDVKTVYPSNTDVAPDELLWREIELSHDYVDFEFFIDSYPNSKYVSIAKFKIKKLNSSASYTGIQKTNLKQVWKDKRTGLIWQVSVKKRKYTLRSANRYCKKLVLNGQKGWRVPYIKELMSILTPNAYKNTKSWTKKSYIKRDLLESNIMPYQLFWSNTYDPDNLSQAWLIDFSKHEINKQYITAESYVRCVKN